jgi:photosystem II stability/assembly factor-like uncharacterized protein
LIRSTDDGATWSEIPTGETAGSRITATLLLPDGSLGATDGTSGLFFRTTDHGESWRTLGRIGTTQGEYAKAFALNRRGDLLAGTFLSSGANIYISRDGGTTWEPRLDSGTTMGIYEIAMAGGDTMFAATYYDGVLRSIDQGESWSRVGEGRLPVEVAMALCIASDGSIFVGGPEGIWWSGDGGDTWSSRTNGLPTRYVPIIYGLNWMPDGTLLASTHGEMFRSSDYGLTWSASDRPPGRGGASTDEFAPTVVAAPDGVLYCSTVNGNAFSGVYRSTDNGDTWSLVSTYPHRGSMWSLTLDREGYLYAATFGAGLWRSSSVSGVPGDRELPGELM